MKDAYLTDADIHAFFTEHLDLVRWLRDRYEHAPLVWAGIEQHAIVALAFNEDSDPHWRKLASYALHEIKTIAGERDLTPSEQRIRSIAERIYDSELTVAAMFDIDLFPEDTDRAAARRERDAAVERALNQMRPYLKPKERIQ